MTEKKENVPRLRFPGFSGEWEEHKLKDLIVKNSKKNKDLDISNVESISNKKGFTKQTEHFEDYSVASADLSNYYVISEKQFAYNPSRINVGSIAYKDEGAETSVVSPLYVSFYTTKDLNDYFLLYWFKTFRFECQRKVLSEGGVRDTLSFNQLSEMNLFLPSVKEQEKIGSILINIDKFITLHEYKLKNVKKLKAGLLQKMFPKDGEDFPEVRFPGFVDAWEQRKVGEFYFFKNGLNKGKEYFGNGTPIVNFTDVFYNRGLEVNQLRGKVMLDDNEIKNFEVRQGDIFFTRTSETIDEIGYPSVMINEPKLTVFSGFVLRGRAIADDPMTNIFKRYVFFTEAFRNEMIKKSSMTTRALTSGTAIKEMCFNFPTSQDEQNLIGSFFVNLDHLITLHQHKLEHLQKQKKALLHNKCLSKRRITT